MKQRLKPVVLLGLGKYGAEITRDMYAIVTEKAKDLTKVASFLVLGENGEYRDLKESESLFECQGLRPELSSGNFSANLRIIQNQEKAFEDLLAERIENIRRREILVELQDKGYEIEESINLFLVSTLFDSIGSAAIIPFLGFIQYLSTGRLRGTIVNTNVLAFFPDLFGEYKTNELAYSRSYSCLQELDQVADHPELISSEAQCPFSFAWIFGGKSEENVDIGSYENLIPMISEILLSVLTGRIASDISFSTVFLKRIGGKATRYSSFGLAKLVFPVDDIMRELSNWLGFNILESKGISTPKVFEKDRIGADVSQFVLENKLDRLFDELELDTNGKRIWLDFKHKGAMNESIVVKSFVSDIEKEARDFDRNESMEMRRKLSLGRDRLLDEKTGKLFSLIRSRIDSKENGVYYAKAFLDVLQNRKSLCTKGDVVEKIYTLDLVESRIKSFFDKMFGVEREKLFELKQAISDKTSALKELEEQSQEEKLGQSLKERIRELEAEIKNLKKAYGSLSKEIAVFDSRIADPSERRKLLDSLENEIKEEMEKARSDLEEVDEKYRDEKQRVDDLYEERRRVVRKLLVVFPCAGTVAFFVILYLISRLPGVSLLSVLKVGGMLYPFGLVGYGVWALSKYWRGIRHEIEKATAKALFLKNEKISLLFAYQELRNRIFKTRFDHSLHGGLLEWIRDYRKFVAKTGEKLQFFIDGLVESSRKKKEAWRSISFPNSLFVRSVVEKEDLERFIAKNARLPLEIGRFFEEKPLSDYFEDFRNTDTLSALEEALTEFSEEVFMPVREESIEDYLKEAEREGRIDIAEKLGNLYDSARAFILLDVEKGMDVSQSLTYLGIENPESSYVKQALRNQGHSDIQPTSVGSKNEIVVSKLKVGFPAFHIALVNYGQKLLSKVEDKKGLYTKPEWGLEELFPSAYILGDDEDEARVTACLGRLFGLIEEKQGQFYFEGKKIGNSYQALIEFLRSFGGSEIRNKVSKQIEEEKSKDKAIDRLVAYEESKKVDEVDRKIIKRVISELSPL